MSKHRGRIFTEAERRESHAAAQARAAAFSADLAPVVRDMQRRGIRTLYGLATALTARGIPTARGGSSWSPTQVRRLLERIEASATPPDER